MTEHVSVMQSTPSVYVESARICEYEYLRAQMTRTIAVMKQVPDPSYRGAPDAPMIMVRRLSGIPHYESFDAGDPRAIQQALDGWIVHFGSWMDAEAFARDWSEVISQREVSTQRLHPAVATTKEPSVVEAHIAA